MGPIDIAVLVLWANWKRHAMTTRIKQEWSNTDQNINKLTHQNTNPLTHIRPRYYKLLGNRCNDLPDGLMVIMRSPYRIYIQEWSGELIDKIKHNVEHLRSLTRIETSQCGLDRSS